MIEKNLNFQEPSKYIYIFLLTVYMYFLIVKPSSLEMMQSKTLVDAHGLKVIWYMLVLIQEHEPSTSCSLQLLLSAGPT